MDKYLRNEKMKKLSLVILTTFLLSACIAKQPPICEASAMIGGVNQSVQVYGVRVVANQTEYKAGYPFNWQWVNKRNFTSSTCSK